MKTINPDTTVAQLVTEKPRRARVFERFGIDFCCGGKTSLKEACTQRGLDPQEVVNALIEADASPPASEDRDWSALSMTELADHIVQTHHTYLREELPYLTAKLERVAEVHGQRHPEMVRCSDVFHALRDELEAHMMKEEQILFPVIKQLEAGDTEAAAHCGSVGNPIRVMEHEHDNAGQALAQMRELTGGYTPPEDACNTYRTVLAGLEELEADLHRHIHKENNILFPKAIAAETRTR